jgi:hypothetical protein
MKRCPTLVTDVPSLDVRRLYREGWLRPGMKWQWVWQARISEGRGAIVIYAHPKSIWTSFRLKNETALKPITQRIQLDWSATHNGGKRVWFSCPDCSQRIALLYLRKNGLRCRRCSALVYPSQYPSRGHSYGRYHRVFDTALYTKCLTESDKRRMFGKCWQQVAVPQETPEIIAQHRCTAATCF